MDSGRYVFAQMTNFVKSSARRQHGILLRTLAISAICANSGCMTKKEIPPPPRPWVSGTCYPGPEIKGSFVVLRVLPLPPDVNHAVAAKVFFKYLPMTVDQDFDRDYLFAGTFYDVVPTLKTVFPGEFDPLYGPCVTPGPTVHVNGKVILLQMIYKKDTETQ